MRDAAATGSRRPLIRLGGFGAPESSGERPAACTIPEYEAALPLRINWATAEPDSVTP